MERVGASSYERVVVDASGNARVLRVEVRSDGVDVTGGSAADDADVLSRVRALFDLDADAPAIDAHLSSRPGGARMRALVAATPGLRIPGAYDVFELAVRTVLGQQVSVAAATTLSARFAARFARPVRVDATAHTEAGARMEAGTAPAFANPRAFPAAAAIARLEIDDVAAIGIPRARAETLVGLSRALVDGRVVLERGAHVDVDGVVSALCEVKGVGPWTAKYLAMRALAARDVFLEEDLVVRRALGVEAPKTAAQRAARFAPYRAHAVLHLWRAQAVAR